MSTRQPKPGKIIASAFAVGLALLVGVRAGACDTWAHVVLGKNSDRAHFDCIESRIDHMG